MARSALSVPQRGTAGGCYLPLIVYNKIPMKGGIPMAFPPSFLAELAARNPIEEVVGQYVNLRRSGSNLFGLCPFHGEKTASFSVAPDKGIY